VGSVMLHATLDLLHTIPAQELNSCLLFLQPKLRVRRAPKWSLTSEGKRCRGSRKRNEVHHERERDDVIMKENNDVVESVHDNIKERCEERAITVERREEQPVKDETNQTSQDEIGTSAVHSEDDDNRFGIACTSKEACVHSSKTDADEEDRSNRVVCSNHEPAPQGTPDVKMDETSFHASLASRQIIKDDPCRKSDDILQLGIPKDHPSDMIACDARTESSLDEVLVHSTMPATLLCLQVAHVCVRCYTARK
jgi:hypothetical protein